MEELEASVARIPSRHRLVVADSRFRPVLPPESVHLVVTSPPYWNLKSYSEAQGQLAVIRDYGEFLDELDLVWKRCFDALVPGGRLVCVVGDVCLSRRRHGRHAVVPLHASIQDRCRQIGFDNLAPIIWHKITNAAYEARRPGTFLGKPYEPNSIVKNDIEFILSQRKPGRYRSPALTTRLLSLIPSQLYKTWFQQVWDDVRGASTKLHPAPYPLEIAERLVRMFSFVGDTVLDPFMGTGTTQLAAAMWARNSIGVEVDSDYVQASIERLQLQAAGDRPIELLV
ncbi:MAG: site-specific DNA-methyltransferase [Acidobacteriota bacterium]|nr:site-specific DNA-methyltransferase [Acidobacteriota bacterium]